MIEIKYDKPKKLAGKQSIYVSFIYKKSIVDCIRLLTDRYYNAKDKTWELDYTSLSFLKDKLPKEEFNIEGTPIDTVTYGEKKVKSFSLSKSIHANLYEHQIQAYNEGMTFPKYIFALDQGLGKSLTALSVAIGRHELNKVKHCLILVCVNGLKYTWEEQIKQFSSYHAEILGNRKNKHGIWSVKNNADKLNDLENIADDDFFLITNIESLRDKAIKKEIQKLIKEKEISCIIVDEVHKCKNSASKQGAALLSISKSIPYLYLLSGTLIINKPIDLYVPLKAVGREIADKDRFQSRYCIMGGYGNYSIVGYKHLDELQQKFNDVSIRKTKEEVLDLPPKIKMVEYVEMGQKQKKIYTDVLSAILDDIDNISLSLDPLSQLIRLRQATADTSILSSTINESVKFDRMAELVEDILETGRSCVIYSNWVEVINRAYDRLKDYKPSLVTGKVKDVESQINNFKTNDDCHIIMGTVGKLGTGYTLTKATTVIFLDEPYTAANKAQAEDRIYRIGTTSSVNIITIICKNTIDEYIHNLVLRKEAMSDIIIDNKYDVHDKDVLTYILTGEGKLE